MKAVTKMVTPELATEWLGKNTHNRRVRARAVGYYAQQLAAGEWIENGETIKFGADGVLLDGQHRLLAIIESKVAVPCLVVTELDPAAFATIDTGIARQAKDVLYLAGEANPNILAAAARIVMQYDASGKRAFPRGVHRYSNQEILNYVRENPKLSECVKFCARGVSLFGAAGAAFYFLFQRVDPVEAEVFIDMLIEGTDLRKTSSVYHLRERLLGQRKIRLREAVREAIFIKAWNLRNERVGVLQYRVDEEFPVIGKPTKDSMRMRARQKKAKAAA